MAAAAAESGDVVIVTSDNPRTEDPVAIIEMALPGVDDELLLHLAVLDTLKLVGDTANDHVRRKAHEAVAGPSLPTADALEQVTTSLLTKRRMR